MVDMRNPEIAAKVAHVQIIGALSIEINAGMPVSRRWSPLKVVKERYGFKGNRKPAALKFMVESMQKLDPTYEPSASTLKAIG